jgi:hypothetical protein
LNIETVEYNKNGIGTVKFRYEGSEDNVEQFIRILLKDCVDKQNNILVKAS